MKCQPLFEHNGSTGASLGISVWIVEMHMNMGSCLKCNELSPIESYQALTSMHATRMGVKSQQWVGNSTTGHVSIEDVLAYALLTHHTQ